MENYATLSILDISTPDCTRLQSEREYIIRLPLALNIATWWMASFF
jgi:hypothetical protein